MTTTTELAEVKASNMAAIEAALATCEPAKLRQMSLMERTLTLADSMEIMRQNFNGAILGRMKRLANTPLGFLTDRPDQTKAYHDDVVRDCVIEAMLRGAQPIGNEFNIIAGRCYLTKQFFERQLRTFSGLTELRLVEGVPSTHQQSGGALVPYRASWLLNGAPDEIICDLNADGTDTRIAVRVNAGMGVDAILGKAKRKMLARIYARITGSDWLEVEDDVAADEILTPQEPVSALPPDIEEILTSMDQISDVSTWEMETAQQMVTEKDQAALREWCDWRREQIKESRGQRANGKG